MTEATADPAGTKESLHNADVQPPAGDLRSVLQCTLQHRVEVLQSWDPLVRQDQEDSVHQFRVAARTLRSVVQVYKPLFKKTPRTQINTSLRDLGRLLSTARDAEVIRDLLDERIETLANSDHTASDHIPLKARNRLREAAEQDYAAAHRAVVEAMDSPWYREQMEKIERFAADVPLKSSLSKSELKKAATALAPLASAHVDKITALADQAEQEQSRRRRATLFHEVRKEAKRLRYAVSAVEDASGIRWGRKLRQRMKAAKKVQKSLGAHQDSVMLQEHVLTVSRKAQNNRESTFGYGLLYATEIQVQAQALKKARKTLRKLSST